MTNIAVLASGEGTNAQVLIDASGNGGLGGGTVTVLVSDRSDAPVLERARKSSVEAVFLDPAQFADRAAYGEALKAVLDERNVELVCLAGFMRILPPNFIKAFESKVLNIHPALLPAFPGPQAVRDALEWGSKITGSTVHFADEKIDHGPIIVQEAVEILDEDDEQALHSRIKDVEHRIYPEAIKAVLSGRCRVEGRVVHVE